MPSLVGAQPNKHPAAPAAKAKAAKPSALEHERELHRIRERHRAEYELSTREGHLGLARRLREEGRIVRAEAIAERYVYWHESARMAILAGDITLAWATIEEIEKLYAVSAFELKAAALEAAAFKKEPLAEPAKMANAAFLAFEDAKLVDPDSASRLLTFAQGAAIEAKETSLITLFASRSKDFQRTRQDIEEGKKAVADVAKSPDDAAINLKAGSYLCFARGDWGAGLQMLAKGSDDELSSLARADLERPTDSAARIAIADSWYGKSKGLAGAFKIHALARACAWYRDALPGLTGFTKERIEKRLGELESVPVVSLDGATQGAHQPETVASIPLPKRPTGLDKARSVFDKAREKDRDELLQRFDREVERITTQRLAAEERAKRINILNAEKERFEKHGLIPWSESMRPYLVAYQKNRARAEAPLEKAFDQEIDKALRAKDTEEVNRLRADMSAVLGAKVLATWNQAIRLYSNGKIGSPDGNATWSFQNGTLTLRWPNAAAPGGAWLDVCPVAADGLSYSGKNQRGTRISGNYALPKAP